MGSARAGSRKRYPSTRSASREALTSPTSRATSPRAWSARTWGAFRTSMSLIFPSGPPSPLHLWWARRPLASSRAVLLGLLWPDPCDPLCPDEFKAKAREILPQVQGKVGSTDEDLRKALLKFIGDFANWDLAANLTYLE